jgi:hypothetical protein
MTPATPDATTAPATDNSTTQSITPAPSDGAADDGAMTPVQPAPAPAPAQ